MNKLISFENFISQKAEQAAAAVREEQEEKRSSSANSFKALLAEYGVAEVAELTEDQRSEFFAKLRGAEVNEMLFCTSLNALNEAVKVSSKREANKVWNVYTKIFNEATALTTDKETHMGAIRQLFWLAMEDANFSREANAIMGLLKAPNRFKSFNVNVPELGNTAIQIGHSTINSYLETAYGRISSAAKWSGVAIVEGTALYLDSIGMAGTGQALIDDFNAQFNESLVSEAFFKAKDFNKTLVTYGVDLKADEIYIVKVAKVIEAGFPTTSDIPDKRFHDMMGMMLEENWLKQYDKLPQPGDILPAPKKDKAFESTVVEKKDEIFTAYIADKRKPGGSDKDIMDDYGLEVKNRDRDGFDVVGSKEDIEAFAADHSIILDEITLAESKVLEKKDELFTAYIADKRKPGGSDKDIMDDYGLQVKNRDRDGFDVVGYKADIEAFAADHSIILDEITLAESKVNEAEIKSDEEFKEYAFAVLKKAFGEDFDEAKATEVVDGILGKTKGDYAKAAGMLQSSLG